MTLLLLLLACKGPAPVPVGDGGLLDQGVLWPYPSAQLVDWRGKLAIPQDALPKADDGTDLPVDRLNWRRGFSVAQSSLLLLPGVDPEALPGMREVQTLGTVRMIDLTAGAEIPCFAELDMHPDAQSDPERQALLVRPLAAMTPGHQVAVVITTDAAPRPERFDQLMAGEEPPGLEGWGPHYLALVDALEERGLDRDEIALAWDFPIGDGTAMLRYMLANTPTPVNWTITDIAEAGVEDDIPPGTYRQLTGTFEVTNWLVDETGWAYDGRWPVPQGTTQASLFIHIPESVMDAEPGTVPVILFGHGLLTDPQHFLADPEDSEDFVDLLNRTDAIVVGTTWRGLTRRDLGAALTVAGDMGRFHELTERLTQGVTNTVALAHMVTEGGLLREPLLEGLADPDHVYYYGVSAGSMLGATTLAQLPEIERGVLHVGGSSWGVSFERSANWADFAPLVEDTIGDPLDRQLLLTNAQLLWDAVEPLSYVEELSGRSILMQLSYGDDELDNFGAEMLARSAGWAILTPSASVPPGVRTVSAPARGPLLAQFDPQLPMPNDDNQPSERTGAHRVPRHWEPAKLQTIQFLDPDGSGVIEHFCGDVVCDPEHAGH
ncbi:MAG: hypothetical protein H6739_02545 [Alphaproteobacteria bacterium]|nr:hypothetical protein [Alphaproteobacteria bacterium]